MTSPNNPFPEKPSDRIFKLRDKFRLTLAQAILPYLDEQAAAAAPAPKEEELFAIEGKGKREYRVRRGDGTWVRVRCDAITSEPEGRGMLIAINIENDNKVISYRTVVATFAVGWTDMVPVKGES
jgi:hypothetical protein